VRAVDGLQDATSSPLRAFARWWPLSVIIVAGCLAIGVDAGHKAAPTYTAETRLAVGGQNLAAQAVPGFALASQQLASDYARYVSLPQDEPALRTALGTRYNEITGLSASPVPTSNIISVEATSADPSVAVAAASAAGGVLQKAVNSVSVATTTTSLLQKYADLSSQVAAASQALATAQRALAGLPKTASSAQDVYATQLVINASSKLSILQLQQVTIGDQYSQQSVSTTPASNIVFIQPSVVISDTKKSNEERYGLAGFAVGVILALMLATMLDRVRTRRRNRRRGSRRSAGAPVPSGPASGAKTPDEVILPGDVVVPGDVSVADEVTVPDDDLRTSEAVGVRHHL
jgi:hypothetical protein